MSWSLNLIGKKAAVAAQVKAQLVNNGNAVNIGTAIIAEIDLIPDPPAAPSGSSAWSADSVMVVGNGHGGSGVNELKIIPFTETLPPPPIPPAAAS